MSCYFYFGLLPLGPELWCYNLVFFVALLMDLFIFVCCVFDSVCELFGETIRNGCG